MSPATTALPTASPSTSRPTTTPLPAFALVTEATAHLWSELHRALVPGLVVFLAALPVAAAALLGQPGWAAGLVVLPCLALTGLARFVDQLVRGDRPRWAAVRAVDVGLALSLAAALVAAVALVAPASPVAVVGYVLCAVVGVLAPYALAYGAARDRRGLAAWRGAVTLVALRPSWALMVLALTCLAFFAVAASAGVLAPVAPVWVLAVAATSVRRLLRENRVIE